jgi:hypothetical protein
MKGDEGMMKFRYSSDKETASYFGQVSEKVRWRPWQWLNKRSGMKA